MHIEIFAKTMRIEGRIIDMNHRRLRQGRENFVGALRGIVGAAFERRRAKRRVESGMSEPGFVNNYLDAFGVRGSNNRCQIVAQTVIGARGQYQRLGIRIIFYRGKNFRFRHRSKQAIASVD